MLEPIEKPEVQLIGEDGNAFTILGKAQQALKSAGADKEYIDSYISKATGGDYNHLLRVTMEYVKVC